MSTITIFGPNHFKQKFKTNFDIFHENTTLKMINKFWKKWLLLRPKNVTTQVVQSLYLFISTLVLQVFPNSINMTVDGNVAETESTVDTNISGTGDQINAQCAFYILT